MKVNNSSPSRNLKPLLIGIGIVSLLSIAGVIFLRQSMAMHQRQAEVALVGSQVMPFDLEATTHEFKPLPDGGLQTVTADSPTDSQQIELIQAHLEEEALNSRLETFPIQLRFMVKICPDWLAYNLALAMSMSNTRRWPTADKFATSPTALI